MKNTNKFLFLGAAASVLIYACLMIVSQYFVPQLSPTSFRTVYFMGAMVLAPRAIEAVVYYAKSVMWMVTIFFMFIMLWKYFYRAYADKALRKIFQVLLAVTLLTSPLTISSDIYSRASVDGSDFLLLLLPCLYFVLYIILGVYMLAKLKMSKIPHLIFAWTVTFFGLIQSLSSFAVLVSSGQTNLFLNSAMILSTMLFFGVTIMIFVHAFMTAPEWKLSEHDAGMADYYKNYTN
jgi:hypothetical protein